MSIELVVVKAELQVDTTAISSVSIRATMNSIGIRMNEC